MRVRVQGESPLGWANLNLFNARGQLLSGRIDVRIWKSSVSRGLRVMGSLDDSVSSSGGAQDRLLKPAGIHVLVLYFASIRPTHTIWLWCSSAIERCIAHIYCIAYEY